MLMIIKIYPELELKLKAGLSTLNLRTFIRME